MQISRSVFGQLGVEIEQTEAGTPIVDERTLYVPAQITTHTEIAHKVGEVIGNLASETSPGQPISWTVKEAESSMEEPVEAGRIFDQSKVKKLEKDEVEAAIKDGRIGLDPLAERYGDNQPVDFVNEDGSITLPISKIEFLFNSNSLGRTEELLNTILHGRAGLVKHLSFRTLRERKRVPDFLVGGVVFSPGPYLWKIRQDVDYDRQIKQIKGASVFDPERSQGTSPFHPVYDRNRQIELINHGSKQKIGETWVTLDIYKNTEDSRSKRLPRNALVDWDSDDPRQLEKRKRIHDQGLNPLDIIKVQAPAIDKAFSDIRSNPADLAGFVVSKHGATKVPRGDYGLDEFTAQNAATAAVSFGRSRSIPEGYDYLKDIVSSLPQSGDRSRTLIIDRLLPEYIPEIIGKADIRAFLVEDFGDLAIDHQHHQALVNKVREGVAIGWRHQDVIRHLHQNGLWMTPESIDALQNVEFVFGMFGGTKELVSQACEPAVQNFLNGIMDHTPADKLGVVHGNGPGHMESFDRISRSLGVQSYGYGIDQRKSRKRQVFMDADGIMLYPKNGIWYRQTGIEDMKDIGVYWPASYGTLSELYISLVNRKLLNKLPAPEIIIDPPGVFKPTHLQAGLLSDTAHLQMWGEIIDIGQSMGRSWLGRTVEHFTDEQSAFKKVNEFIRDPGAYWHEIGVPRHDIKKALKSNTEAKANLGMKMPDSLKRAAQRY